MDHLEMQASFIREAFFSERVTTWLRGRYLDPVTSASLLSSISDAILKRIELRKEREKEREQDQEGERMDH